MAVTISVYISYSQLAIFSSALQHPYNDWTDEHVAQGFSWRAGSVSFYTLVEAGVHSVEVDFVKRFPPLDEEVIRAIEVPFDVPSDGAIEVGSISETVPLAFPSGSFLLRCEFFCPAEGFDGRVRLIFAKESKRHFRIVRADSMISSVKKLLITARSACDE
jgi:hypothetical protein